jgi:hypothetical protein
MTSPASVKIGGAQIKALIQDLSASAIAAPTTAPTVAQKDFDLTLNRGLVPFQDATDYDISYCYLSLTNKGLLAATDFATPASLTASTGNGVLVTIAAVPAGVPYIGVSVNGFVTQIYPTDPAIWSATSGTFEQKLPVFSINVQGHNSTSAMASSSNILPCKILDLGLLEDGVEIITNTNANTLAISGMGQDTYLGVPFVTVKGSFAYPGPELEAFLSGASYFPGDADLPAILPMGKITSACSQGAIFKIYTPSIECGKTSLLTFYGGANSTEDLTQNYKNNEATRLSVTFTEKACSLFQNVRTAISTTV